MMATITIDTDILLHFNEVKSHEGRRINRPLTHKEFLEYLLNVYCSIRNDNLVLNSVWKNIKENNDQKRST